MPDRRCRHDPEHSPPQSGRHRSDHVEQAEQPVVTAQFRECPRQERRSGSPDQVRSRPTSQRPRTRSGAADRAPAAPLLEVLLNLDLDLPGGGRVAAGVALAVDL
ncbi:hypothetical protein GCM10027597_12940 [Saccharopolyspora tripterygii]